MKARRIDAAGAAGPAIDFGASTPGLGLTTSVVYSAPDYAVLWSAKLNGAAHTWFIRLGAAGPLGPEVDLTGAAGDHYIARAVRTTSGYAVLLNGGSPPDAVYVLALDGSGTPVGSARHLLGVSYAWDIAAVGSGLGVIANRKTGEAAFRSLDASGDPVAPFRCVDGPSAQTFNLAAIDADGAGYAIVYRTPAGAEAFVRTDATGSAAP
jgi:hypothetical protein